MFLSTILTMLISCGKTSHNEIVGEWFYSESKSISIRSDKTWKADDAYGSGTWKYLDDQIVELTDFYGSTQEICIEEDEYGLYITYRQKSYKNEYPTIENNNDSGGSDDHETIAVKTKIDPFDGIQYMVTGISPYCKLTANQANCSEDAQMYVKYQFDKEYYQNGDVATITASFIDMNDDKKYELTTSTHEYTIEKQAEYVTSPESADLTLLKEELEDYISGEIAKAKGNVAHGYMNVFLFDYNVGAPFQSREDVTRYDVTQLDTYFSVKKANKRYSVGGYYNIISFTYKIECTNESTGEKVVFYPCIRAVDIVQNPDGSIRWADNLGFASASNKTSIEDCVEIEIMQNKVNYNISKVKN